MRGRWRGLLRWWLAAALGLVLAVTARAHDGLQPVPPLRAHINDLSGTLSPADTAQLEQQLADFERRQGTQIAVLMVPSTAPLDISDYTQRVAETWKLGRPGVGDGLLLVVAVQDRRVRIAPYKALEGAIPDVMAKRIIDEQIVPAFRQGDHAGGLRQGLTRLQALISGEALPAPMEGSRPEGTLDWVEAVFVLLVAVPAVSAVLRQLLGRRLGALAAAVAVGLLVWLLSGRWWLALLVALIAVVSGLLSRGLTVSTGRGGPWRSHHDTGPGGWGGGRSGWGGGMSSGGGGDAGGGGASGRW